MIRRRTATAGLIPRAAGLLLQAQGKIAGVQIPVLPEPRHGCVPRTPRR